MLTEAWKQVNSAKNYQSFRHRLIDPIKIAQEYKELLSAANILDIGCNNGVISAILAQFSRTVVGIERKPVLYEKALITKQVLQSIEVEVSNLLYKNQSFKDYIRSGAFKRDGIDAIIACQVLYHLDDEEIDLLMQKCYAISWILVTSSSIRSRGRNRYKLFDSVKMKQFLVKCGFKSVKTFKQRTRYPIFVGLR